MTTRHIPDQVRVPNAQQTGRPNRDSLALTRLPDPPKPPDAMQQFPHVDRAYTVLNDYYRDRPDVLVACDGYLCYDASDIRRAPRPDCLIALDVAIPPASIIEANGYMISEIGKPPDFVLEVASESTGRRDYTVKRDIYAGYLVGEQWRFDPTGGRFHDAPLAGDRLVNGELVPIPVVTGTDGILRGYSEALGLELHWDRGILRFWDPTTAEYLPDMAEVKSQRDAAVIQRDAEAEARRIAESQRDAEAEARRISDAQRDAAVIQRDAEAEVRRISDAQRDAAVIQRDAEAEARRISDAQRDAEAAARQAAEERVRQLESQLRRPRSDS